MISSDFKQLKVWGRSIELVKEIYALIKKFPVDERYGLCDQLRRAAVSIPSNIAEGHGRNSDRDFIRFLLIARGSLCEIETQCIIAVEVGMIPREDIQKIYELNSEIARMIKSLISYLEIRNRSLSSKKF